MRSIAIIGGIAVVHLVIVAVVAMQGGCGTMPPSGDSGMAPMPPSIEPVTSAVVDPVPVNVPPMSTVSSTYIVKKGDSLSGIAQAHGVSTRAIASLNGISNPDKIREGQKLTIPGKGEKVIKAPRPIPAKRDVAPSAATGGIYVVKAGDTLSEIAVANGISISVLKSANSLTSDKILIGQKLRVPGANKTQDPVPAVDSSRDSSPSVNVDPVEESAVTRGPAVDETPVITAPERSFAEEVRYERRRVEEGDDIVRFSMRWGAKPSVIMYINDLSEDDQIRPGDMLNIPAGN